MSRSLSVAIVRVSYHENGDSNEFCDACDTMQVGSEAERPAVEGWFR